jgi:hypothetical protein
MSPSTMSRLITILVFTIAVTVLIFTIAVTVLVFTILIISVLVITIFTTRYNTPILP